VAYPTNGQPNLRPGAIERNQWSRPPTPPLRSTSCGPSSLTPPRRSSTTSPRASTRTAEADSAPGSTAPRSSPCWRRHETAPGRLHRRPQGAAEGEGQAQPPLGPALGPADPDVPALVRGRGLRPGRPVRRAARDHAPSRTPDPQFRHPRRPRDPARRRRSAPPAPATSRLAAGWPWSRTPSLEA
jgi:hypothetical protein